MAPKFFAFSDFYKYYNTNEDFALKSGHRVLLKAVVEEIKNVGPKVFNGMLLKKLAEEEHQILQQQPRADWLPNK
jgi:hypothetical protein